MLHSRERLDACRSFQLRPHTSGLERGKQDEREKTNHGNSPSGEGAIFIHGSAELGRRLSEADLIDRYNLLVFPVLLGSGKSVFCRADRDKQMSSLRESEAYSNGVVKVLYDVERFLGAREQGED